ncbi:uncharacterized protein LOC122243351 isoform X2 [Penaeus japonicus]|nr:uncharacterized protein LOC122243351 isoform X2 [Penaeus japonicus]XP_042856821.1 uncharacterized protein LOC122243351 isoform X2 [Penaeus japonicus]
MPQPRPPGSLKEQCVRNITVNMDSFWCQDYIKNWLSQSKSLIFVLGPFEDLPSTLIEMIIEELNASGKLRKHHLHLLLLYHLERLKLSRETSEFSYILSLLAQRCKKLRHLGLKSRNLPRKMVNEIFINLELLQTVDLSQTNVADQTLSVMGAYAKHIRVLNLADTDVTDIGISSLCHGIKMSTIHPSEKTHISQSLLKLDLYGTVVTPKGIQCALINMPNLKEIVHSTLLFSVSKLVESRQRMAEEALVLGGDIQELGPLQLRAVQSDEFGGGAFGVFADAEHITTALSVCPSVQYLYLRDISNVKSNSFLPISKLKNVIDLVLTLSDDVHVDFYEQIFPLLQCHGESLRRLHLQNVQKINVELIGHLCPELQILELDGNNTYCHSGQVSKEFKNKKSKPKFNNLKSLNLSHVPNDILESLEFQISAECLRLTLGSPLLEKVSVMGQDLLTNEILLDVMQTTKLPHLSFLSLTLCNNIDNVSIWTLIHLNNPLSELNLIDCQEITFGDYNGFQKYIKKNKLALKISWA